MLASILVSLAAIATSVNAAPFERRGSAQILSNCNHDFAYTWDDGPYTAHNDITAAFNAVGGKTTYFVNGDNWSCIYDQDNVDALRASYAAGHQIASHTWSHAHLSTLSQAQIDEQIMRLDEALVKILGIKPKFLRPPYGELPSEAMINYIQNTHGKTIVLWSDDSTDSTGGSTQDSINFYTNFANENPKRPHMTLSHETEPAGYGAMYAGTVQTLHNGGVNLVTVAQCLDSDPYIYVGAPGVRDSTWTCSGTWHPTTTTSTTRSSTSTTRSSTSTTRSSTSTTPTSTRSSTSTTPTSTRSSTVSSTSTTATQTCIYTYTSGPNDTCASIEATWHLPAGAILAANSFLNCNDIWQYTPICIPPGGSTSTQTPTSTPTSTTSRTTSSTSSTTSASSCVSTYSAVAGDTCASIEFNYDLPSGSIQAANTFLNCSDIWAWTPICIPPGGSGCTKKYTVQANGETCTTIGNQFGVSAAQIQSWNTFLNCNDIWQYTPVCVKH